VADFVPTVFQGLVRHLAAQPVELAALRLVIIGGEAMNAAAVGEFQALHPAVGVVNTYGPTEASIGSVWYRVPAGCPGPVPIGRPLPNVRAVILDRQGRLAPPGMVGELCLGGDCVGLGYLGDPDGTRARFIANPFPELRCDTLYRTGDAARLRPDGLLECLGRLDDQLKIRGLRIEPGEVEAALLRHPAVQQAVVTAVAGSGQLRAHLVFAPSVPQPGAGALRDFLLGLLPQFMVPSAFVAVPRLPAASSGKIDRRAVAALPGKVLKQAPPYAPPTTQAERALLALWRELLAVERIGIHDNFFFDLGGDSLQALLFVGRWEAWTGCRTGVSRLFAAPTIASFAASLAASGEAPGAGHDLLALQRAHVAGWKGARLSPQSLLFAATPSGCAHPLFWCCQGFHELAQMARHLGAQQPLVGMRSGHLVMEYTPANLDLLAGHYASEIVLAQPQGAIVLGGNCQGGLVARAVALHLQRAGREVALLILMEDSQFGPYDGRVALLYGSDSHLNPFRGGRDPGAILGQAYSRGYSVAFIPGSHGKFFRDENIPGLAAAMAACMEAAAPARPAALSGCFEGQGG
jgi:aryl carrier-like protein